VAWKGQYTRGDQAGPTVMLEAVASHDLWIWHAFFGVAGSNNDINVLNRSPLFTEVVQGRAPEIQFTVNGNEYNMGYYLANGIYPEWATFVKTIHCLNATKTNCLQKGKREQEKMWSVHLVCCKLALQYCRCPNPAVQHQLVKMLRDPNPRWLMQEVTQLRKGLFWFQQRGRTSSRGVRVHCIILHRSAYSRGIQARREREEGSQVSAK